jgi:predicted transcriptional regulator
MVMARRETLVQLNDDLVKALDRLSAARGVRRSALIRYVLQTFVESEDDKEKERRLIEGYRRYPPGEPDEWGDLEAWGDSAIRDAMSDEQAWPEKSDE